jgi:hypothetical protein
MAFPTTELFGPGYPGNGFFVFRWSYFSAVQVLLLLRELPGSWVKEIIAGVPESRK